MIELVKAGVIDASGNLYTEECLRNAAEEDSRFVFLEESKTFCLTKEAACSVAVQVGDLVMRKKLQPATIERLSRISKLVQLGLVIVSETPTTVASGVCVIYTPEPVDVGLWEGCGRIYELRKAPHLEAYYGFDLKRDEAIIVIPATSPLVRPPHPT